MTGSFVIFLAIIIHIKSEYHILYTAQIDKIMMETSAFH